MCCTIGCSMWCPVGVGAPVWWYTNMVMIFIRWKKVCFFIYSGFFFLQSFYRYFLDPNARLLIIANHQSTADVPLMMQAFTSKSEYNLLWVMDSVFKWTNFGLVSQTHGDFFLNTKAYKNGALLKHCIKSYARLKNLVVLFPEGLNLFVGWLV